MSGTWLLRVTVAFFAFLVGLVSVAIAQTTNQARSKMLEQLVGRYTCSDTGPGDQPYTAVVKVEGGWVVWREQKDDPSTEYLRWDPNQHAYVVIEVEQKGGYVISTTGDSDPLNATWKHEYPASNVYGAMHTTFAKNVFTVAVPFHEDGQTRIGRLTCKKS